MTVESTWEATGIAKPKADPLPRDINVEVAIIGAGYCGLNAGLELASQNVETAVFDALPLGKGASGRSGGFVGGRFRMPPTTVKRNFGDQMVELMQRISQASVDQVAHNVDSLEIPEAQFKRHGTIRGAICAAHFKRMREAMKAQSSFHFGDTKSLILLDRREVSELTGCERFLGGVLDPTAPGVHPFNYTMGLARALVNKGVAVYAETPITNILESADGVELKAGQHVVRARQVIIATDAYSRLTKAPNPLASRVMPLRSSAIATAPLSPELAAQVLPRRHMVVDSRRVLRWLRMVDGRVVFGGRGAEKATDDNAAYANMHLQLIEIYPQLATVAIQHRWSGYVGMTLDLLPHIGRASDKVVFAGGFNGNGVALASLFGRYAAKITLGEAPEVGILGAQTMSRFPFYPISQQGVRVVVRLMQLLDAIGI